MELTEPAVSSGLKFNIYRYQKPYPNAALQKYAIANASVTAKQVERVNTKRTITNKMKNLQVALIESALWIKNKGWEQLNVQWLLSPTLPTIPKEDNVTISDVHETYFTVQINSTHLDLENPPLKERQVTASVPRPRWNKKAVTFAFEKNINLW